jgi:tetratricopeptide (TPR) repeat protein
MEWGIGNFACLYAISFGDSWTELLVWSRSLQPAIEELIRAIVETIDQLLTGFSNLLGRHLQSLITLASFSFGVWKWYRYREAALLRRLREFLEREERGLRHARSNLLEIVCRPAPGQRTTAPLFSVEPLRRVLLKRYWRPTLSIADPITGTDRRLNRALRQIDKQLDWGERQQAFFRQQRASVHLLRGAIASARSERVSDAQVRWQLNNEALTHFRDALGSLGKTSDVDATEYKAHQLRKLGELNLAFDCYEEMERLADAIEAPKRKSIAISRAKRYQAEIIHVSQDAPSQNAADLLEAALEQLAPFAPLVNRDLLEQAEVHELHGCVRLRRGHPHVAKSNFLAAKEEYQRLLDSLDPKKQRLLRRLWQHIRRFFYDDGTGALRKAAQDGLARVARALESGQCDGYLVAASA